MQLLKAISALMDYPSAELQEARQELHDVITASREISPANREDLITLLDELCLGDIMTVQEKYGDMFDRGRWTSLLMFEHVHGESRDRGQAMVDLMAVYNENGFHINVRELPDYIPLYLEYLSRQGDIEAREGLADVAHIFGLMSVRLADRESPYRFLFEALLVIAGVPVDLEELKQQIANEEPDNTMEAFDKVWEEEQVTFVANQQNIDGTGTDCAPSTAPMKAKEPIAEAIHWVPND